ncbi:ArsR/SmtB family transcription factor [Bacillus gaemokensis]|uniref:ArsR family transcriptional regulator n=1 Tax=Bacillus gaemokensis TaxID=574375 RepID=A0A073K7B9_9BACI|nr:helix-turn-helix domain-containing protein [Bacillus gaemokensis]KEK22435.1 ArsR family transcriptional regulator [Bacillus gaemokensis]KYG25901.1 ArsR family transcriptional regulator [Bacillus gaemokensis]
MNVNVAHIASLISDTSRATILVQLLDGRPYPATELAHVAKIKPQTASFHLNKLYEAQIVEVEKHGRHRYYKIANHEIAESLEKILYLAPPEPIQSFKQSKESKEIQYARTCYDHLAGKLGVEITNSLLHNEILIKDDLQFKVTKKGLKFFENFGINLDSLHNKRRFFSKCCLDWSERQHHIAGSLGNAILERMLELKWITKASQTRAVYITPLGKQQIFNTFLIK